MLYSPKNLKAIFRSFLLQKISVSQTLVLNIVTVKPSLASQKYMEIKQKVGSELGIEVKIYKFLENIKSSKIQNILKESQISKEGLIFQLPIPQKFDFLVNSTPIFSDVDLLGNGHLILENLGFLPPTIGAIDLVLKDILQQKSSKFLNPEKNFDRFLDYQLDLTGQLVAIIGQGKLVGTPLLSYFKNRGATIISINKFTHNLNELISKAKIIVSAAGNPNLLSTKNFSSETILIDASTSEVNGSLVGDINFSDLEFSSILCPSPGGIGALTVLYLFYNLYLLKQENQKVSQFLNQSKWF